MGLKCAHLLCVSGPASLASLTDRWQEDKGALTHLGQTEQLLCDAPPARCHGKHEDPLGKASGLQRLGERTGCRETCGAHASTKQNLNAMHRGWRETPPGVQRRDS